MTAPPTLEALLCAAAETGSRYVELRVTAAGRDALLARYQDAVRAMPGFIDAAGARHTPPVGEEWYAMADGDLSYLAATVVCRSAARTVYIPGVCMAAAFPHTAECPAFIAVLEDPTIDTDRPQDGRWEPLSLLRIVQLVQDRAAVVCFMEPEVARHSATEGFRYRPRCLPRTELLGVFPRDPAGTGEPAGKRPRGWRVEHRSLPDFASDEQRARAAAGGDPVVYVAVCASLPGFRAVVRRWTGQAFGAPLPPSPPLIDWLLTHAGRDCPALAWTAVEEWRASLRGVWTAAAPSSWPAPTGPDGSTDVALLGWASVDAVRDDNGRLTGLVLSGSLPHGCAPGDPALLRLSDPVLNEWAAQLARARGGGFFRLRAGGQLPGAATPSDFVIVEADGGAATGAPCTLRIGPDEQDARGALALVAGVPAPEPEPAEPAPPAATKKHRRGWGVYARLAALGLVGIGVLGAGIFAYQRATDTVLQGRPAGSIARPPAPASDGGITTGPNPLPPEPEPEPLPRFGPEPPPKATPKPKPKPKPKAKPKAAFGPELPPKQKPPDQGLIKPQPTGPRPKFGPEPPPKAEPEPPQQPAPPNPPEPPPKAEPEPEPPKPGPPQQPEPPKPGPPQQPEPPKPEPAPEGFFPKFLAFRKRVLRSEPGQAISNALRAFDKAARHRAHRGQYA